jgi:hypothetical protein
MDQTEQEQPQVPDFDGLRLSSTRRTIPRSAISVAVARKPLKMTCHMSSLRSFLSRSSSLILALSFSPGWVLCGEPTTRCLASYCSCPPQRGCCALWGQKCPRGEWWSTRRRRTEGITVAPRVHTKSHSSFLSFPLATQVPQTDRRRGRSHTTTKHPLHRVRPNLATPPEAAHLSSSLVAKPRHYREQPSAAVARHGSQQCDGHGGADKCGRGE